MCRHLERSSIFKKPEEERFSSIVQARDNLSVNGINPYFPRSDEKDLIQQPLNYL